MIMNIQNYSSCTCTYRIIIILNFPNYVFSKHSIKVVFNTVMFLTSQSRTIVRQEDITEKFCCLVFSLSSSWLNVELTKLCTCSPTHQWQITRNQGFTNGLVMQRILTKKVLTLSWLLLPTTLMDIEGNQWSTEARDY